MAPATPASVATYAKDEKVLCFHHELLYEAKVLEVRRTDAKDKTSPHEYRIHYKGWKNTWDDWVPQDRLRKLTDDNRELANNLKRDLVQTQPTRTSAKPAGSSRKGKGQGSDLGSGRGSEERHSSVPAGGRGTKRGKDNDVEKVGSFYSLVFHLVISPNLSMDGRCSIHSSDFSETSEHSSSGSSEKGSSGSRTTVLVTFLATSVKIPNTTPVPFDTMIPVDSSTDEGCIIHSSAFSRTIEGLRLPSGYSTHYVLDSSSESLAMPPARREVTTVGGRRINQGRRRSNWETVSRYSDRPSRQEVDSEEEAYSETADDILARSPPPDLPEYISRTTEKSGMFWAPLISGSTQEEKDLMNQELAAAGKFQFPEHHHPQYVQTRINDPGNLNRLLFYEGQDPNTRLVLAGVPNAPLNLDPPGTGSPFDALKHPKSLIARLNRLPEDPDGLPYGWDDEALKKIPHGIITKLPPKTLHTLPESVRTSLPTMLLARDPEDPPAPPTLPAVSRLARRSQRVSTEDEEMPGINNLTAIRRYSLRNQRTLTDEEEMLDTPEPPAISRSTHGRQRMTSHDEETPGINDMSAPEKVDLPKLPAYMYPPKYPGIGKTRLTFQHGLTKHQPSPVPQPSPQPPALRRRGKIRHACDKCRSKRLKCDGTHPSCNTCKTSGVQCSYGGGATQGGDGQSLPAEEQPEEQTRGPGPEQEPEPPGEWRQEQTSNQPEEQPATIAAANPERGVLPLTNVQIEGHEFATAADHEPISTNLNLGVDRIVFAAVRGPFGYQLGVTPELAGHSISKSKTDHLSLQENTTIPLKFHPKPVLTQMPNFRKNVRARTVKAYTEVRLPQEETFMARPSVRIVVPDHLKNLLVDDWENVTKSLLVVPLPSKAPVNFIIDSYFDEEKGKRRLGSAEADVLEEFVAGMKVYFDKAIGKTLLYKFERPQWAEIRQLWESGKYPEWNGKGPGDAYGAEHLCRMLVNMPEMVAQTNMDVQSVNRLREEISKLCSWLARNSGRFFCAKYEKPTAEYIEGAR